MFPLRVMFQELSRPKGNSTNATGNLLSALLMHMLLVKLLTCFVGISLSTSVTEVATS